MNCQVGTWLEDFNRNVGSSDIYTQNFFMDIITLEFLYLNPRTFASSNVARRTGILQGKKSLKTMNYISVIS